MTSYKVIDKRGYAHEDEQGRVSWIAPGKVFPGAMITEDRATQLLKQGRVEKASGKEEKKAPEPDNKLMPTDVDNKINKKSKKGKK